MYGIQSYLEGLAVPDAPGLNLANATATTTQAVLSRMIYGFGAISRFYVV